MLSESTFPIARSKGMVYTAELKLEGRPVSAEEVYIHPHGIWRVKLPDNSFQIHRIEDVGYGKFRLESFGIFSEAEDGLCAIYKRWKDHQESRSNRAMAWQIKKLGQMTAWRRAT